ncbi:hypothetical protein KK083_24890 [Fulvivirgaceae bacterium PWU4]|uniref:Universal stress protein n=1 Tax=Chryseosolibacter histidini TaxID=2782349 RepID=A0AAP2GLI2_9BACT|nr:universal stress protein [Chryseosolibacter histidini]MBT1700149.1 hypothetical protein [Chryseosolibacter histidini]
MKKKVLIPTTFEEDTKTALRLATDIYQGSAAEITLCTISEISDSITELLFLDAKDHIDVSKRDAIISFWNQHKKAAHEKAEVSLHHQFGLSQPKFNRMMERFEPDMVVVPQSFQQSPEYIHQFALRLFHTSRYPMMLLPGNAETVKGIQRALYLDESQQQASSVAVQQYPFHVIHKSMVEGQEYGSTRTIVEKMQIDLIVKPKRKKGLPVEHDRDAGTFGLPILTI